MSLLSRDAILDADDRVFEKVDVPEWGGAVRVSVMTGEQRDRFDSALSYMKGNLENVRALLCSMTIVDDSGDLLFSSVDIDALGRRSARALERVFDVAQRINALRQSDAEAAVKN